MKEAGKKPNRLTSFPSSLEEIKSYVAGGGELPKSKKIIGIRRLWHEDKSENFQLEGCFTAVLKAAGGLPDYNCALFEAISGTLFTQLYHFTGAHGLSAVLGHQLIPHIFSQIGYSYLYIDHKTITEDYELAVAAVKTAVNKGIPVISSGIGKIQLKDGICEHHKEWCNIGGYDENDILYVNAFPDDIPVDENGYCTAKSGLKMSGGLYILERKIYDSAISDICRKAIQSIPVFVSLSAYRGVSFGQKAYYDWADGLLHDENIEKIEDDPYKGFLWWGHNAPWINALTCECHMRMFFDKIGEWSGLPEAPRVKEIYARIYDNLPKIQKLHGGDFFAAPEVIKQSDRRKKLAAVLNHMGDLHNELSACFDGTK